MFTTRITGIILLVFTVLAIGYAQEAPRYIIPEVPEILAFADGAMAPAAPTASLFGGNLIRNAEQLTITRGDTTLRFRLNSKAMEWARGGKKRKVALPLAPFELNGEVYVPFLLLVGALDGLATRQPDLPGYLVSIGDATLRFREHALKVEPSAYRETEPQVYLLSLGSMTLTRLTYFEGGTGLPACSPAGDVMAFTRFGAVYLRSLNNPEAEVLLCANYDGMERTYASPCFTPDGKAILFTKYERNAEEAKGRETVGIVGLDGTGEKTLTDGSAPRLMMEKSVVGIGVLLNTGRDGTAILRGGASQGFTEGMVLFLVRRQTVSGLIKVTEVNPAETYAQVLADLKGMAPGDKAVSLSQCFTCTTGDGNTAPFRTGLAHPVLGVINFAPFFPLEGNGAVRSSSGLTVAWTASEVGNPVIKVADLVTRKTKVLSTGHSPAFSPDGKRIVFIDGNGNLVLIGADGKNARNLQLAWRGSLSHPAFTPDGADVLFLRGGTLCAINPGGRTAREMTRGVTVRDYAVCPDGKHLLLTAVPGTP